MQYYQENGVSSNTSTNKCVEFEIQLRKLKFNHYLARSHNYKIKCMNYLNLFIGQSKNLKVKLITYVGKNNIF